MNQLLEAVEILTKAVAILILVQEEEFRLQKNVKIAEKVIAIDHHQENILIVINQVKEEKDMIVHQKKIKIKRNHNENILQMIKSLIVQNQEEDMTVQKKKKIERNNRVEGYQLHPLLLPQMILHHVHLQQMQKKAEMERKRKEMLENANWRSEHRKETIEKTHEMLKKEYVESQKHVQSGLSFIRPMLQSAMDDQTLEDSVNACRIEELLVQVEICKKLLLVVNLYFCWLWYYYIFFCNFDF